MDIFVSKIYQCNLVSLSKIELFLVVWMYFNGEITKIVKYLITTVSIRNLSKILISIQI
jgi:hypothetical protein